MMRLIKKLLLWIYNVYAFLIFLVLMIPVFLFSLYASFFGNIKGGNLIYKACRVWANLWFSLIWIQHKNIYEQKPDKNASYIFVANHISYFDAPIVIKTFRKPLRPLGKVELSSLPIFGFIYKKAIVTVDRSSPENRARSVLILKSILKKGISILVFPEGTFNITSQPLKSFYDGAFRIAIETQTDVVPVLFLDAYDRMPYHSFISLNPGRSRSVFLPPVSVAGLTIADVVALREQVYNQMEQKLIAYGASWINGSGHDI